MPKTARTRATRFVSAGGVLVMGALLAGAASMAEATSRHHAAARGSDAVAVQRIVAQAGRGDPHAQAMLGFMYANGRGVPQSYDLAVDWYLRSADQGDPDGQYLLGLMYDKGLGVNVNVVVAHKWLNLAAAHAPLQNRDNFLRMRDAVGSKMTPAQLDLAEKLATDFIPMRP